ncbi:MAG: hypothetical protein H0T62_09755 [Parachlamydiaceae bacterium]|nr:hypothetical protein [Parachlamydiaceae bacterium]
MDTIQPHSQQNESGSRDPEKADTVAKKQLEEFQKHIIFNTEGPNKIGHLIVEGHTESISQATWLYIKNGLEHYKKTKPIFVILELDTPGGEVFSAQQISDALKVFDIQESIPVVCFINNWAISAGAMLAYSCRFIVTSKDASMGAAEPVIMGEGIQTKPASEKINSALRTDFANRAFFFDRNPLIAEAMVDKDLIIVERKGVITKLDNDSQIISSGPDADYVISPKGKLLTLNAEQMLKYGVSDLLLKPQKIGFISDLEREKGQWPADKMLLFHSPFFKEIPQATIHSYQMDWKLKFFAFLASPMVSSLLLLGMIMGIYIELSTPGFGLPGALGVISLILIILSSFALEIASWLEVILMLVGITIILIDLFLLPTFGILGFAGLLFFVGGLLGLLIPGLDSIEYETGTNTFNAAGEFVLERLIWYSLTFFAAAILIILLARYLTPVIGAYSSLVLTGNEQDAANGYISGNDPNLLPKKGTKGVVLATLRPSGKVQIDNEVYEAMSPGNFIEKGEPVIIIGLESGVLVVDKVYQNGSIGIDL